MTTDPTRAALRAEGIRLLMAFRDAEEAWTSYCNETRDSDGHGGSPGEGLWEEAGGAKHALEQHFLDNAEVYLSAEAEPVAETLEYERGSPTISGTEHERIALAEKSTTYWLQQHALYYGKWQEAERALADAKAELTRKDAAIGSLFDAIKHGDEKHQAWLRDKIDEHFRAALAPKGET